MLKKSVLIALALVVTGSIVAKVHTFKTEEKAQTFISDNPDKQCQMLEKSTTATTRPFRVECAND